MSKFKFTDYLSFELNYSAHTVVAYKKDLENFESFISPVELIDVVKSDIKLYLVFLLRQGLQERSINRKISSLRAYYKFLLITETISRLPTEGIKSLKHYKKVQIPYSSKEIEALLNSNLFENTFESQRNKLILEVFYHTGIRRAELIGLSLSDIDLIKKEIKVLGKRNKERIIPINNKLIDSIKDYIQIADNEGFNLDNFFFVTPNGKSLYPKLVYRITNYYLSLVTEKNKKSPHILRHSFATHLLNNGAEINAVKEILGHSSLAATQNYTHNDINQLKKVFNQTHPRESK